MGMYMILVIVILYIHFCGYIQCYHGYHFVLMLENCYSNLSVYTNIRVLDKYLCLALLTSEGSLLGCVLHY